MKKIFDFRQIWFVIEVLKTLTLQLKNFLASDFISIKILNNF